MPFVKRVVYLSIWIWAIVLLSGPGTLFAQFDKLDESWRWVHFTTETGLPSNRVFAIQETPSGTVWVATQAGLAWFDGYYWHPAQGLPQDRAAIIVPSADDRVIVLMSGRVFQGGEGGFQLIPLTRDGKPVKVSSLSYLSDGKNLVVVDSTIYLLKDEVLEPYTVSSILSGQKVLDIKTTGDGGLWINTTSGLYRRSRTAWSLVLPAPQLPLGIERLVAGVDGRALGYIWNPQEMKGVWEIDPHEVPRRLVEEGPDFVQAIDIAPNGNAIMALETGRVRLRQQHSWQSLPTHAPQMESSLAFRFRNNGDLWVGTERGVFLFLASSTQWAHWGHRDLDDRSSINEIIQRRDSSIWIARGRGLEIHNKDGTIREIEQINGVDLHPVTGLAEDREGNVWISSGGGFAGTYRWNGRKWQHFGRKEGLSARLIHKIVTDRRGRPWFLGLSGYDPQTSDGTNGPGAFVYTDGSFVRWGENEGLRNGRVYAFAEGVQGELWFGTRTGISCQKDGKWTYWGRAEGLKSELVFTLAVDHENRLWFGDREFGVGLIEHVVPRYFTTADGLISDAVWHLTVGADGRLWVATRGGLSSFFRGAWMSLGPSAGLNHANLWPLLALKDELYVGTTGGGTAILRLGEIGERNPVIVPAPAVVENASVLLRWDTFGYLGERAHNEIETRYRLNDNQWSPWSLEREVTLADCSPGDYRFVIQAKSFWGTYDSLGQSISFSVPFPFYMQPVYYLPTALLLMGVVVLVVVQSLRKKKFDRALSRSEARYRSVVEDQSEFIVRFLPDGTLTFVNGAYCRQYGKDFTDLIGTNFFTCLSEEDRDRVRKKLAELTPENPLATDEHRTIAAHQDTCWLQWTDRAVFDGKQRLVEYQSVGHDITERKRAEEALVESHGLLQTVISTAPVRVFWKDRESRYLGCNSAFAKDAGVAYPNDLIGKDDYQLGWKAQAEVYRADDRQIMDSGIPKLSYVEPQTTPDGHKVWLRTSKVPLLNERNETIGVLGIYEDITESKRAEEVLRESQSRLSLFFSQSLDGFYFSMLDEPKAWNERTDKEEILDYVFSHQRITEVNDAMLAQYGATRENFIGRPLSAFFKHDSEQGRRLRRRLFDEGRLHVETSELKEDGTPIWIEGDYVCMYDERQRIVGTFGIQRDITERKQGAMLLEASERSYKGLFNTVNDAIYILDSEGKFIDVNDGAVEMYGYPREYFVGKTPEFISAPGRNDLSATQEAIRNAFTGTPQQFEWWGLRKNGEVFPKDVRLKRGSYFGTDVIIALGLDITERKRVEEVLRASEEQFRRITENMRDVVCETDERGLFRYVSPSFYAALGYKESDVIRQPLFDFLHPDDYTRVKRQYLRGALPREGDELEFRYRHLSGHYLHVSVTGTALVDDQGKPRGAVLSCRDITERKQAQERYRRIVEGTHAILFNTTAQGYFTYANEAACRMLEIPLDQLVGRLFARWVHPDDRRRVMATYREQASVGIQSVATEFRYVSAGGKEGWLSFLSNPVLRGGEVVEISGIAQDITARKKAEEALRESEELYRTLVGASPDSITVTDMNGSITFASTKAVELFGESSFDDVIGRSLLEWVSLGEREKAAANIRHVLVEGYPKDTEYVLLKKDGTQFIGEISVAAVRAADGDSKGLIVVTRDITERKHAEEALAEREKRYRALFDLSPSGILLEDALGNILEANDALCKSFHYSREELMGRNITILVPPEHHPDIKQHIAELLTGKTLEHEVDNIAKDGTVHHMELRETAIPLADGRTGILSVTNDITERKRIEAVLHETNQTLEALIAASPLAIVIVDPAGLIRLWNPAAESIFGWKAEEVLGKPNPIVPPEKLEEVLDLQKRITDGCETVLGLEVTRRRKNESPIQVSLSTAALHGNDGTVTGVMAIIEDITERKQAAAALHQRNTFIEMILENSPIGFAVNTVDDGRAQFVSSRFEEIYGVPHDSLDSAESFFNEVYHDQEFRAQIRSRTMSDIASGDPARMIWEDIPITTRAGITKYVTATNIPLYEQNLMVSTVQDVTARRLAEEQTRASLREKEVLLKEIHHRVKNNLQVISSLLNLQSSYVKDSHALELFKESQNRVKSMALIHEKLYQSENFANIDFAFYVKNLTGFLYRSYVIDPSIVTIAVDIQGIQLNIEKAIPCGLIINELVSNSLKYAFPSGNAGRVFVGLTASDDSILKLVVSDNGVGLPEHISLRAAESLGLQLVASLADQLGATIEVKRVGGTEYGISFPR